MSDFLPTTKEEMLARGWEQPDFVYISGDAYVDHPSFGAAIITRTLESRGFKVCFWHSQIGIVWKILNVLENHDLVF